ncbi:TIGR03936 family radical SAM-associated protein [Gemmiger sp.]|uniref:TIGR03936 family radical SAM-associated protein n=1 Tax=Gemmiger sp. TaxID=2049027 RepID=UPI003F0782B4
MITVRIRFHKVGEAAYISLLDLQRVFHRILKRSGLPVYYTQGFNPHIYLSFACPLSLGQESICECCEVKTEAENQDFSRWREALQPLMPRGIEITWIGPAVNKVGEIDHAGYTVTVPASAAPALEEYNAASSAPVLKKSKRGKKELDLKEYLPHLDYSPCEEGLQFSFTLPCGSGEAPNLNPALLLGYLQQKSEIPPWLCSVMRTQLYTKNNEEFC